MKTNWIAGAVACGLLTIAGGAQQTQPTKQTNPPASDNTKTNQRDRNSNEPTADNAKNATNDRDIMQKIRKSVMDDKSLSTYAHNVKIISQNGKVTLKGPVRTSDEKDKIEKLATDVAGAGNVTDEITVKPSKSKTN